MNFWQISKFNVFFSGISLLLQLEAFFLSLKPKQNLFLALRDKSYLNRTPKIHNYQKYQSGSDYFFEISYPADTAIMTGEGKDIQVSDIFILLVNDQVRRYRVEEIDYYCPPSNIWIARLQEVS